MNTLPIISIANLISNDQSIRLSEVEKLGHACRKVGFFYISEHGISKSLMSDIFNCAHLFFALPKAQKEQLSIRNSPHNRGYVATSDEKLNPESGADLKEGFNIGTDFPPDHPDVLAGKPFRGVNFWPSIEGWKEKALAYMDACLTIGRVLHRGFSQDLGVDPQIFEHALEFPVVTLRMLHYPASSKEDDRPDSGAGTHTDYGNVTILATDGVAGLEVQTRTGEWIEAPYIEGTFVCNIGDCLMRWTNDTYISTPHRVRQPKRERYSIPFFLEVDPDTVIDPRDIRPDEVPHYEPITFAEYLTERLNATYKSRG